ncbi:glycosyl transferase family 2 [Hymenobacter roseosalivarius DSM 11622]|uniref:Glycosyl transferase family 2 n=1 Tax=Hymenobacter roseosalivarius DSM 11622 TaxID=645990 RepID=A0A1W1W480_9BACT|nr:glycosyltransferase family 2 protein [Hymenobacter roseosalivarius]SMC00429.1 glycosyl transferase family 2 [Hymenobacter roseosalivarius DSM 11622]
MLPHVAVVILNWNGRELLRTFLPSVLAHSDGARVVVVDNASTDDSVELLGGFFPTIEVIQHSENLGFCAGYNQALARIDAAYYVLLNSDVAVTPGWLRPLVALLDRQPLAAACQPKLLAYAEPMQFEYAGAGGGYLDRLGYPLCRGRLFETLETDHGQYNDARPVAWASGACMMVRASTWHKLDGLETAFFAHMEEIDLCWRFWNAGYEVWYEGSSTVFHVGGGTLHKSNPRKTYLNFRNGLALLYKNAPQSELGGIFIQRIALDWIAALRMLGQGAIADARAVLRAHRDFFKNRNYWRQQRMAARPHLLVSERPGVYVGSLVWAYFGLGKRTFTDLQIPDGTPLPSQRAAQVHPESQGKV